MNSETAAAPDSPSWLHATAHRLGRDYAYVLAGFPLALLSFCLLVPLLAFSVSTLIIGVGALVLPFTLMLASSFAQISRARLAQWGVSPEQVRYRPAAPGVMGMVKTAADPRRWLDLAFEAVVALPLRFMTFCISVTWTAAVVAGLSYWTWAALLPGDDRGGWAHLISLVDPELPLVNGGSAYLLDSGINLAIGVVTLLTLPPVMRGLAALDAQLTVHLLGDGAQAQLLGHIAQEPPPTDDSADRRTDPLDWATRELTVLTLISTVTVVASIILVAVSWPVLSSHYQVHPAIAMVLSIAHATAAILAVRWWWAGLSLSIAAVIGQATATADILTEVFWPWSVTALLTQCLLIIVVALRRPWRIAVIAWAASLIPAFAAPALFADTISAGAVDNGIVAAGVLAGVGLLAVLVRLWGLSVGRVEAAEKTSAEESSRRKGLEERNRIARELHDVVAHSMSVISVQASTAKYRRPGIDDPVQQEFEDIAESSRQALSEMRALLAVLRGDDAAPTSPAPGVRDIDDLVEATRASGASITFSGGYPQTSPTVGLTAFRVVQEALSNALRHAPGAPIDVAVNQAAENLEIRVINGAGRTDADPSPGSGLGLVGLRERVTALGGTASAEPAPNGGFIVTASLPLNER